MIMQPGGAAELGFVIPLTKIDVEKRLVYGVAAVEEPDKSREIFDYATSKPYMQKWSDGIHAASGGLSKGNLRAMHQKQAIGRFDSIDFDDTNKLVKVCAHVVDDGEWKKVQAGVYTGFSVGGGYAKSWQDPTGLKRYTADVREISLVDNPCMPSARIAELVKADGLIGHLELRGTAPTFGEAWTSRPKTFGELMKFLPGLDAMSESPTGGAIGGAAVGGLLGASRLLHNGKHSGKLALAGAAAGAAGGYLSRKASNGINRWTNKKAPFFFGLNAYNQRADRRAADEKAADDEHKGRAASHAKSRGDGRFDESKHRRNKGKFSKFDDGDGGLGDLLEKAYDESKHARNKGKFASEGGTRRKSKNDLFLHVKPGPDYMTRFGHHAVRNAMWGAGIGGLLGLRVQNPLGGAMAGGLLGAQAALLTAIPDEHEYQLITRGEAKQRGLLKAFDRKRVHGSSRDS